MEAIERKREEGRDALMPPEARQGIGQGPLPGQGQIATESRRR